MFKAKLVVVGGDVEFDEVDLQLPATIGRGREAHITLAHPLVSRQHCELYGHQDILHVRDLGSMNGTFVGKEQITDRVLSRKHSPKGWNLEESVWRGLEEFSNSGHHECLCPPN